MTGFQQVFPAVHSSAAVPVDGILFSEIEFPFFFNQCWAPVALGIHTDKIFPVKAEVSQTAGKVHYFPEFHQKNVFATSNEHYLMSPHLLLWYRISSHDTVSLF